VHLGGHLIDGYVSRVQVAKKRQTSMYGLLLLLLLQQIHNQAIKSTSSKKLCKSYYVHSWEENKNLPKGVREAGRPSS